MDFLTPIGLGGLWLAYFLWQLQRAAAAGRSTTPNRAHALHLRHIDEEEAAREEALHHG